MEVIDGKEYLSVAEFAAKMGVTRRTVYRWTHVTAMSQHCVTCHNQIFIDAAMVSASGVTPDCVIMSQNVTTNVTDVTSTDAVTDALVDLLRDQLAAKDAEISRLHDELDRLHGDVEKLHTLLDQAQKLTAMQHTKELEEPQRKRWRRR